MRQGIFVQVGGGEDAQGEAANGVAEEGAFESQVTVSDAVGVEASEAAQRGAPGDVDALDHEGLVREPKVHPCWCGVFRRRIRGATAVVVVGAG